MNYKTYIYIVSVFLSVFALSGINFTNFFKKNKEIEAKIFVFIVTFALAYLLGTFVIEFIECSKLL